MKKPNLALNPIAVGFGGSILKERIIAIMKFKKPTALSLVLSAFLVIGVVGTGTFAEAVMPKAPDTVSEQEPVITTSEPTVTASELVPEIDETESKAENSKPETVASEDKPEGEILVNDDSIWLEPDENGFSYCKYADLIRVPVVEITSNSNPLKGKSYCAKHILDENGEKHIFAVRFDNLPDGYTHCIYFGYEYAIVEKSDFDSSVQENCTHEEIIDDEIIRG